MTSTNPPRRPQRPPGSWRTPLMLVVGALPVLALLHLALLVLLATLQSGLWPLTPQIDPKDASFPGHAMLVFLFLMAAVVSPLPWVAVTWAPVPGVRPAGRVLGTVLFVAGYALFWVVIRSDPWGTVIWLGD